MAKVVTYSLRLTGNAHSFIPRPTSNPDEQGQHYECVVCGLKVVTDDLAPFQGTCEGTARAAQSHVKDLSLAEFKEAKAKLVARRDQLCAELDAINDALKN